MVDAFSFEVQKASWQDLKELYRLDRVCFGEDAWPWWDLIAVLILPKIIRLKAVVNHRLVGFIAGDPNESERTGWIAILGVMPEYRRRGIAEQLLAECEKGFYFDRIRLSVRKNNEAALRLYRKAGYYNVDLWRNYYYSGEDALVLEKRR